MNDLRRSEANTDWFALGKSAFASDQLPQSGPLLQDALRVLSIVRALHEEGYQRIRVYTCLSPSGVYWRCFITSADNVEENGWTLKESLSTVAIYSSTDEAAPFGWKDVERKTARDLAHMFVERFSEIAARGEGCDRAYVDWYAGIMATAETVRLPVFCADFKIDLSAVSVPPPPRDNRQVDGPRASRVQD